MKKLAVFLFGTIPKTRGLCPSTLYLFIHLINNFMKNFIFILSFFISLAICTSCSNDEAITTNTTNEIEGSYNQGFNTLKEDFYEYNVNTFHPTRNIWGFFKKLWKKVAVFTADALGGTVGAVFGGGVPGLLMPVTTYGTFLLD